MAIRRARRTWRIILGLFLAALICFGAALLVFHTVLGYRYATREDRRYFGTVNPAGDALKGTLSCPGGVTVDLILTDHLVYSSYIPKSYGDISIDLSEDMAFAGADGVSLPFIEGGAALFYGELGELLEEADKAGVKVVSGNVTTADGIVWELVPKSAGAEGYVEFTLAQTGGYPDKFEGDVALFSEKKSIRSGRLELSDGGHVSLVHRPSIYRLTYKYRGDEDVYIGQMDRDFRRAGAGVYFNLKNKFIFIGSYERDRSVGDCAMYMADGSVYVGGILEDKITGEGKYTWADGSSYEGGLLDGLRHGYGVYISELGERYEGYFENDARNGAGTYMFDNGDVYTGEWRNDKRTGKGVYMWSSGERYEGTFVDNVIHGYGSYYWPTGRRYEGYFKDGVLTTEVVEPPSVAIEN